MANPLRLILASASPARRRLLEQAGYAFEARPSHVDEPSGAGFTSPRGVVEHIAWLKACAVAKEIQGEAWVLAADTIGWLNGEVIAKPADADDARRIIKLLGGTTHELWTGVCLWHKPDDLQIAWQERSLVRMAALDEAALEDYIASNGWVGHSGAYAIQEEGDDPLVQVVEGTVSNVVGMPMETLGRVLEKLPE